MYTCYPVCMCYGTWVEVRGNFEGGSSPPTCLRQDLLLFPTACTRKPGPPASGDYIHELLFRLWVCSGDLSSGPYTGQASTVPREPSPTPSLVTFTHTRLQALTATVCATHFALVYFFNFIWLHRLLQ